MQKSWIGADSTGRGFSVLRYLPFFVLMAVGGQELSTSHLGVRRIADYTDYADDADCRMGDGGQNYASHTAPLDRKRHLETLL